MGNKPTITNEEKQEIIRLNQEYFHTMEHLSRVVSRYEDEYRPEPKASEDFDDMPKDFGKAIDFLLRFIDDSDAEVAITIWSKTKWADKGM